MANEARRLAIRLAKAERVAAGLSGGPQLGTSSLDGGGALVEHDENGSVVSSFGRQHDGTHGSAVLNGPKPHIPSAAECIGGPGTIKIHYNGTYADGSVHALDYHFTDAMVSQDPEMLDAVYGGSFVGSGDITFTTWESGVYYVALVAESKPGLRSDMSVPVRVVVDETVLQYELDQALGVLEEADAALALADQQLDERLTTASGDLTAAEGRLDTAEQTINVTFPARFGDIETDLSAVPADIAAAKQAAIDAAALDATQKADAAEAAAEAAAALDATAKAEQAEADATAAAALDAQAKANAAEQAAIDAAAVTAQLKADGAEQAAIDAAAITAQQKADAAEAAAEAAAALDATAKANAAEAAATQAAATDATEKANAAQAAAEAAAKTYTDGQVGPVVTRVGAAEQDILAAKGRLDTNETAITSAKGRLDTAEVKINTLEVTTIPNLTTRVTDAENDITTLNTTTIPALQNDVSTLETTTIPTLRNDLTGATDRLTTAEQDLDDAELELATKLPQISTDGGMVVARNVLNHWDAGASIPGSLVVRTNIPFTGPMIRVNFYGSQLTQGDVEGEFSMYAYANDGGTIYHPRYTTTGDRAVSLRFAKTAEGLLAFIIDLADGGTWKYLRFSIPEVQMGYRNEPSYLEGWTASTTEDLTEYLPTMVSAVASRDLNETHELTQGWRKTGTVDINGGAIAADSVTAIQVNAQSVGAEVGEFVEAHVGNLVVGTANMQLAVAQHIAGQTASFQQVDAKNIFVTGTASLSDVVAQRFAAETGTFMKLGVDQLTAGTAAIDSAVVNKFSADIATVIKLNASAITSGTVDTLRLNTSAIAAATASIQQVDAANITVTGTSNLSDVVAERMAAKTGQFIQLSVDQLTVPGTAAITDLVAQHFAARTSALIEADIGKLTVTAGATINEAVVTELFSQVVKARTVTATEAFIGGNAILSGEVFARHITATEDVIAKIVKSDSFLGKSFTGATFTTTNGGAFQTSELLNTGLKLTSNGLEAWNPASERTYWLDPNTGAVTMEGLLTATGTGDYGTITAVLGPSTADTDTSVGSRPGLVFQGTDPAYVIHPGISSSNGVDITLGSGGHSQDISGSYSWMQLANGGGKLRTPAGFEIDAYPASLSLYAPSLYLGAQNTIAQGPIELETGEWHYVGAAGEPAFQNGYRNEPNIDNPLKFKQDATGRCWLTGSVSPVNNGSAIFTLPPDLFPGNETGGNIVLWQSADPQRIGEIKIYMNGNVTFWVSGNSGGSYVSMNGVTWLPASVA